MGSQATAQPQSQVDCPEWASLLAEHTGEEKTFNKVRRCQGVQNITAGQVKTLREISLTDEAIWTKTGAKRFQIRTLLDEETTILILCTYLDSHRYLRRLWVS